MWKTILLTKISKQYLEIKLTKDVKDLYNENFKALKEELEEGTGKWK
jgi:hypothetical protein